MTDEARQKSSVLRSALTLEEALGSTEGKRIALVWTYHPKARPLAVPHGVGVMATKLGMHLQVGASRRRTTPRGPVACWSGPI